MNSTAEIQHRLGPIKLVAGVKPRQIFIFLFVVITAHCMSLFMPLMQAFVFTEMLHLPKSVQGRLTGNLTTVQQIAILIFISISGALADRLGRKAMLIMALGGFSFCLFVYPLAPSIAVLFVIQFLFGIASTGHTAGSSTMMVDYPDNASRGKFISFMLISQSIASAILVGWLGAQIPGYLVRTGIEPSIAGRYAFWAAASLGVLGIVVAVFFLKNVRKPVASKLTTSGLAEGLRVWRKNFKEIWGHARRNPRFGLVMTMGFVIRSDFVVIYTFLALWVINSASGQGVSSAEALKTAGLLLSVFKVASIISPVIFGWVADRVDRSVLLVSTLAVTGLTLISTLLVTDVFGYGIVVVIALIGIAEQALIVGAATLFGQEAPAHMRGAANGVYALMGTFSVVVVSFVGGFLFDKIGYVAPFVLVGCLNMFFAAFGTLMVRKTWGQKSASVAST